MNWFALLQIGVPGGLEVVVLFLILLIPLSIGYWVGQDASKRGSNHPLAWGAMAFVSAFGYGFMLVVFLVFFFVVRRDIGGAGPHAEPA